MMTCPDWLSAPFWLTRWGMRREMRGLLTDGLVDCDHEFENRDYEVHRVTYWNITQRGRRALETKGS